MSEQVLSVSGVQKYYGAKLILDDVNFNLNRGERAVLVGENGVGKSTLARLILGIESVERGTIRRGPGSIVAYLPQELQVGDRLTVEEYISESLGELTSLQRRLRALESQMAEGEDIAAALEKYGHLQTLFDLRGGYTLDARRKQVFAGLDLDHIDVTRSVMSLSGGEKTRIAAWRYCCCRRRIC